MTEEEIVRIANAFFEKEYKLKLMIPIVSNGRIKKVLGSFSL
ncbi:hypothetical protein [Thermoactinomyces sp. DSM 45892]|nr:hypothetical protein [Thermoactinomyces sp. DSM 45892]